MNRWGTAPAPRRALFLACATLLVASISSATWAASAAPDEPTHRRAITTTTTTAPATTIPASPAPSVTAPPTTATPPPAPTTPPAPPAPPRPATVEAVFAAAVPAAWREAIPTTIEIIPGSTSWATPGGRIELAEAELGASTTRIAVVLAHEFGHQIAFRHGTQAHVGAAPAGWPSATSDPAEHWADCVQQAFTGTVSPSHGLPACSGPQLEWTRQYLAAGPRR